MPNKSINTLSRPLSDVLSQDLSLDNVKLIDYLVDSADYDGSVSLQEQPNAAFVYEISLNVDIDRVIETGIEGYQLKVVNPINNAILGEGPDRVDPFTYQAFFAEDFPDSMNTGDNDFDTIAEKISQVQTVLLSEDAADEGRIIAPSITSESYASLGEPSTSQILGTGMRGATGAPSTFLQVLESGEDPSEAAAMTMPTFALSSSRLFDSLTNDDQSTITYAFLSLIHI